MARGQTKRDHAAQGRGLERGTAGHEKEGDRLDEHSAPGPMTLMVNEGRIRFSAADEEVEAGAGTVLACDAGVRHSVEALGDAVCLLNVVTGSERRELG